jgi:hypothetical protein
MAYTEASDNLMNPGNVEDLGRCRRLFKTQRRKVPGTDSETVKENRPYPPNKGLGIRAGQDRRMAERPYKGDR